VISGDVVVALEDGTEVVHDTRVALCRCGKSGNMPFCDNSHRAIGWRDAAGDAAGDAARARGPEVRSEAASLEDGPRLA
jgi:CDGSH-type Zn-finger protein